MAKQPRTERSGKEVRYILQQNNVNKTWLAEQLGISPQTLNSRLNATVFRKPYLIEINGVLGKDLFGINEEVIIPKAGQQPILDIRVSAGYGIGLEEGNERKVNEYVSIPGLSGCFGLTVYGESMSPKYRPGDVVFVRPILDRQDIDYGRPYVIVTTSDRLMKCIYQSTHDNDCLRLTSINEEVNRQGDRLYPDREIRKENILFLYKVVGTLQREQL